jgi:hypothetical protein
MGIEEVDVIDSLAVDVASRLNTVAEFETPSMYMYSVAKIDDDIPRITLPASMYQYAGMTLDGNKHRVIFDVYLILKAKSLTKVDLESQSLKAATLLLGKVRNAFFCHNSPTGHKWVLESELPETSDSDFLLYSQRWWTITQGIR